MALPLGKLTIIIGAGILGSVLAKEGGMSNVSDFVSGAFKIVYKQLKHDDSTSRSTAKPRTDSLMAQVNSIREELQSLGSSRSIMIVTGSGTGRGQKYGVIVIVIVLGYGYVWWKGWKLPDLMFATKRSLSDACNSVARQLETVYSSISDTKKHLSSRIDRVDSNLDECGELTAATRDEVSQLRGDMKTVGVDVESVHHAVRTLESKISRIEGKQDLTNEGVRRLCDYAWHMENNKTTERIQATPSSSSQPALGAPKPPMITPSRTVSLPRTLLSLEPPSPSSTGSNYDQFQTPLQSSVSDSGLKELKGILIAAEAVSSPRISNGIRFSQDTSNGPPSSGLFGQVTGLAASFLSRTRSATQSSK